MMEPQVPMNQPAAKAGLRSERSFPPTPPPENEFAPSKPTRANTVAGNGMAPGFSGARSMSMRGGPPPRERSRNRVDELSEGGYSARRQQQGMQEEMGAPRRAYTTRAPSNNTASRSRSVREAPRGDMREQLQPLRQERRPPPGRTMSEYSDEVEGNPYGDELYDMYQAPQPQRAPSQRVGMGGGGGSMRRAMSRRAPPVAVYPDEDEYASDAYEGSSFDEGEFEMMDGRAAQPRRVEVKKV